MGRFGCSVNWNLTNDYAILPVLPGLRHETVDLLRSVSSDSGREPWNLSCLADSRKTNETSKSSCLGEPMPVVACRNHFLRDIVTAGRYALFIMALCLFAHGSLQTQASTVAQPPAAGSGVPGDEPDAPAAATVQQESPAPTEPGQDNPAGLNCVQKVIDQHALARKIRAINSPLARIPEKQYQEMRRNVLSGTLTGASNAADLENLSLFLQYRLFQATDAAFVANPDNVKGLFNEMDREIRNAGNQIGNAQEQRRYRQKYCDVVLSVAKQMFDNSLDARVVAIQILKQLYVEKKQTRTDTHSESLAALVGILKDADQPDAVKVNAAEAVGFVLANTAVIPQEQDAVADAIAAELEDPCAEWSYQLVLVDALFNITSPRKSVGRKDTNVIRTFVKLVDDQSRRLEVRCRAAHGIGQGAYDNQVVFDPLAWKVANLALEASVYFNRAPGHPAWQQCGADLFFAFRHADKNGLAKQPPMLPQGMMNRAPQSPAVKESFDFAVKIAVPMVVNNSKVPQADQQALKEWIDDNKALGGKDWGN